MSQPQSAYDVGPVSFSGFKPFAFIFNLKNFSF